MRVFAKCFPILILILVIIGCKNDFRENIKSFNNNDFRKEIEISKNGVKREIFISSKYPQLLAVGYFGSMKCTVVLVADDIVVTASHCLEEKAVIEAGKISEVKYNLPATGAKVLFKDLEYRLVGAYVVKRIISANSETDFAILQLDSKIPIDKVKPLKIKNLSLEEMLGNEKILGCAGFNGDKGLGYFGSVMTISRDIKIITESSSKERIDTNCISTSGGSGGLLFEEVFDNKSKQSEIYFLGVIWGVTNDNFDEKEKSYKNADVITSITPVSVFYTELNKLIKKE